MCKKWVNVLVLMAAFFLVACQKESAETLLEPTTGDSSKVIARLSYGDSLFFPKNQTAAYTVLPVSKPNVSGYFKSIPVGLSLDSATGRINITQSVSGVRYKIFYLSAATALPVDSVKIVISGIDYYDDIYEIATTTNTYDTSFPIYNAKRSAVLPCGDDDEDGDGDLDDDDNGCVFDETDLNNDGNDDIAGVIQDKLLVDTKKGTIDVEASFHAGVFGSTNPANGVRKDFTFYYRLQDASNLALQKIDVRLYHYKRRSDIPQWLLNEMQVRSDYLANINARGYEAGRLIQYFSKRPPLIVVVSSY
jgi:hypothetical protein